MCRILYARSDQPFSIPSLLKPFAEMSEASPEYQGHGWGCAWRENNKWKQHHNISPIWDDELDGFGDTNLLMIHARSAFRDEGIVIENNMPFSDGESVFIFNGELRGVRIQSEGRIGAEKIYNYIRRFDKGDKHAALVRGTDIIKKRSSYVRAMNIILSDGDQSCLSSSYGENPDYFQMVRTHRDNIDIIASQPLDNQPDWTRIDNNTNLTL